jgi:hypothetical protein
VIPAPVIVFSVDKNQVPQGATIQLNWGTLNADTVKINSYPHPLSGMKTSIVSVAKDYIVEAFGPGGSASAKIPVSLSSNNPPIVNAFYASPSIVNLGKPSSIVWSVTGADTVTIDNNIGDVPASGSLPITLTAVATYTYKLTASSSGGVATAICQITVGSPISGVLGGGQIPVYLDVRHEAQGGALGNGYAINLAQYNALMQANLRVGGNALTYGQFLQFMNNGAKLGASALSAQSFDSFVQACYNVTASGGGLIGGNALMPGSPKTYDETGFGGVKVIGFSDSRDLLPDFIQTPFDKIPVFGKNYSHKAIKDGNWNDPDTWDVQVAPVFGNDVYIPFGREVVIADVNAAAKDVLVGGKIRYLTNVDTKLYLVTMLVMPNGEYVQGTVDDPVHPSVKSIMEFADVPLAAFGGLGMLDATAIKKLRDCRNLVSDDCYS